MVCIFDTECQSKQLPEPLQNEHRRYIDFFKHVLRIHQLENVYKDCSDYIRSNKFLFILKIATYEMYERKTGTKRGNDIFVYFMNNLSTDDPIDMHLVYFVELKRIMNTMEFKISSMYDNGVLKEKYMFYLKLLDLMTSSCSVSILRIPSVSAYITSEFGAEILEHFCELTSIEYFCYACLRKMSE